MYLNILENSSSFNTLPFQKCAILLSLYIFVFLSFFFYLFRHSKTVGCSTDYLQIVLTAYCAGRFTVYQPRKQPHSHINAVLTESFSLSHNLQCLHGETIIPSLQPLSWTYLYDFIIVFLGDYTHS